MHLGNLSPEEQEQLRLRVLAGDKDARDQLAGLLLRFFRRFRFLDEDIVQEHMIRLFDELDQQDPAKGPLHAWCIARAKLATRFAELKAWKVFHHHPSYDGAPREEKYSPEELMYDDRTFEQREAHRIVHGALARMGPVPRVVLTLELEGYSKREIAKALAVSASRASALLASAKQSLAEAISIA